MLRNNQEIVPILLPNSKPKKIAQYADDISIISENKKCLPSIWKILHRYEKLTGVKVNEGKTEILLIGSWSNRQREISPLQYRKFIKDSVKILRTYFGKKAFIKHQFTT